MAKTYSGNNSLLALMRIVKTALSTKINAARINATLTSDDATEVLAASQGKVLKGLIDTQKTELEQKITDELSGLTDGTTEVGNAAKLGGQLPAYYAVAETTQTALDAKIPTSAKGTANGVAPLGADGTVPSEYLPGYVDDVIEMKQVAGDTEGVTKWVVVDPDEGVTTTEVGFVKGKIYLDVDTNLSYRWGGTELVLITSSDLVEMTADEIQNMWDSIEVTANEGDENA